MAFLRPLQFTYLCGYNLSRNGSLGHDSISTFSPSFQQYPSSPPSISIHNPRGLSDDMLSRYSYTLPGSCSSISSGGWFGQILHRQSYSCENCIFQHHWMLKSGHHVPINVNVFKLQRVFWPFWVKWCSMKSACFTLLCPLRDSVFLIPVVNLCLPQCPQLPPSWSRVLFGVPGVVSAHRGRLGLQ